MIDELVGVNVDCDRIRRARRDVERVAFVGAVKIGPLGVAGSYPVRPSRSRSR